MTTDLTYILPALGPLLSVIIWVLTRKGQVADRASATKPEIIAGEAQFRRDLLTQIKIIQEENRMLRQELALAKGQPFANFVSTPPEARQPD